MAIVNNADMNIGMHILFQISVFVFFRYTPRSGIAGHMVVNITKKKQTHRYREQTSGYQWGEGSGEGQCRGRGLRGTNYYT